MKLPQTLTVKDAHIYDDVQSFVQGRKTVAILRYIDPRLKLACTIDCCDTVYCEQGHLASLSRSA